MQALLWVAGVIWRGGTAEAQTTGAPPSVPVLLTLDAAAGCPDQPAFLAQVRSHAPRVREAAPGEPARTLRVELRPDGARFLGSLTVRELDGEVGRRELRDADCASVAAGLAFVAAVIVDPESARTASGPLPAAASVSGASARSSATTAPVSSDAARGPDGSRSHLSAGGAVEIAEGIGPALGVVPRFFVDLELWGLLRRASARVSIGRAFTRSASTALGTANITLTEVRFEPCLDAWSPGPFRLRGCGLGLVAVLEGTGSKTNDAQSATRASLELGLALRPTWIVGDRVTLGVLVGWAVPIARYRFYFAPNETAYELGAWSGFAEFSAGVRFW